MVEFRAVPAARHDRMAELLQYAFRPEDGPASVDGVATPQSTLFDRYGVYDDGDLVAVCKLYTLEARLRGEFVALGGLGAVATAPEHRRRGYARHLCRGALETYREADVGLVALWPFSTPFYRQFGWATANTYTEYEFAPDALPTYHPSGQLRRLGPDDWERLRRVETAVGRGTALSLRRSEGWWRERTLAGWDGGTDPYCYGYERDGTLEGYVVYTVDDEAGTTTLTVDDLAHADEEAYRGLLDFLGGHGAQVERIRLRRRVETDLLDRVADPDAVTCTVEPGPMVRLTDLTHLRRLDWPDRDLTFTLGVSDPLLDRTDGVVRVTVEDGTATVDWDADGTTAEDADVTTDIGTLSQLVVGTHDVETAARLDHVRIADDSLRAPLGAVFAGRPVCLREFF